MEQKISFNESELKEIYNRHVKLPESYFKKYSNVPACPVKSFEYSWKNYDFPRVWCILDFIEWTEKHNIKNIKKLGYTCNTDPELEFLNPESKTILEYPEYDLHEISQYFKEEFDFFLFNQTIEHLYNPFEAIRQIFTTIKHGGYIFTSVPTVNISHNAPIHFNGFNPMGLALLFKCAGFEIIEIGQFGNYEYLSRMFKTQSWPGYNDLQKNNFIPNEENNVCQCWILARKPLILDS